MYRDFQKLLIDVYTVGSFGSYLGDRAPLKVITIDQYGIQQDLGLSLKRVNLIIFCLLYNFLSSTL